MRRRARSGTPIDMETGGLAKLEVVSAIAGRARPSVTADLHRTVYEDEKRSAPLSA